MKDTKTKEAFIIARAEGKSYSKIAEELKISKGTCTKWEQELRADIDTLKQERLEELYTAYRMTREARIAGLGETLKRIDSAIEEIPLEEIAPDKLLSLKLKYVQALKEEYKEAPSETDNTLDSLLEQYNKMYEEAKDVKEKLSILNAKKETLKDIAKELNAEEDSRDIFTDNIVESLTYDSKLLRGRGTEA